MGTAEAGNAPEHAVTDSLIKSVMQDQKRVSSRDILPELEPVDEDDDSPQPTTANGKASRRVRSSKAYSTSLTERVRNYRPTGKHLIFGGLLLVMILRPWLIPGILFLTFWIGLIAWLTLGPDRILEWFGNGWDRLSARNPDLAERLRQRGDAFALRFDAMLDKLPDSWAEKLALPDMSRPVEADKDLSAEPDPFDKLKLPEVYRG